MSLELNVVTHCSFNKIRTLSRYITNLYTKALKDLGITPVQYSMMTAIRLLDESNINTLSQALKMDRTTINRNLKPLVRDDHIVINESGDKRERIIRMTPKGNIVYEQAYENWQEAQASFQKVLGAKQWKELQSMLDRVNNIIENK